MARRLPAPLRAFVLVVLGLAALAAPAHAFPSAFGPVAQNPADRLASQPIDPYNYDYARHCLHGPQRGPLALQSWLGRHARGLSWGIMRCEKLGRTNYSLHSEGRALDWHLDATSAGDRREAARLISLFLASDRAGNAHALARRMGIQEIIWNCQAWFDGDGGMQPYSACYDDHGHRKAHVDPTLGHRNHIHLGLNWAGARMRTSFWRSGLR